MDAIGREGKKDAAGDTVNESAAAADWIQDRKEACLELLEPARWELVWHWKPKKRKRK